LSVIKFKNIYKEKAKKGPGAPKKANFLGKLQKKKGGGTP